MHPVSQPSLPPLDQVVNRLSQVWESGMITNHTNVRELELALESRHQIRHAVAVSSATAGMMLCLRYANLTDQGEVILPAFTFPATSHVVRWNGLVPRFVDVNPTTYTLDPAKVKQAISAKTQAILDVTMWGNPCDVENLEAIASEHDLFLLFDSAQGLGSSRYNIPLGRGGNAEVFSMSPTKLTTACEGGIVMTEDDDLAEFVRQARNYGLGEAGEGMAVGLNGRMSELHAVVANEGLTAMDAHIERRLVLRERYASQLKDIEGLTLVPPADGAGLNGVYMPTVIDEAAFGISRDALQAKLRDAGVETRTYGDPAMHKLLCNNDLDSIVGLELPVTEHISESILILPLFSHMTDAQVDRVSDCIKSIYAEYRPA